MGGYGGYSDDPGFLIRAVDGICYISIEQIVLSKKKCGGFLNHSLNAAHRAISRHLRTPTVSNVSSTFKFPHSSTSKHEHVPRSPCSRRKYPHEQHAFEELQELGNGGATLICSVLSIRHDDPKHGTRDAIHSILSPSTPARHLLQPSLLLQHLVDQLLCRPISAAKARVSTAVQIYLRDGARVKKA
ncbi:hypothetical protein BGZ60DRAFT_237429 [Tricladium varicosporioides]|nr:hypothetical protein BGZ60DRAFT_237429 [Hymenoscyphus varicosporioides]